jgi:hypothetical protein
MKRGVDHGFPLAFAKNKRKNKRQAEKTSGKAEVRSRERLLTSVLFCTVGTILDM